MWGRRGLGTWSSRWDASLNATAWAPQPGCPRPGATACHCWAARAAAVQGLPAGAGVRAWRPLLAQVLAVEERSTGRYMYVWDGTDAHPYPIE